MRRLVKCKQAFQYLLYYLNVETKKKHITFNSNCIISKRIIAINERVKQIEFISTTFITDMVNTELGVIYKIETMRHLIIHGKYL